MPLRGLAVLVVEDDRDHRELARDMLTALGAQVTVATNGEEGVKRLIAKGCPDLILCDLRMPVMDGYEPRPRGHAGVQIGDITSQFRSDQKRACAVTIW